MWGVRSQAKITFKIFKFIKDSINRNIHLADFPAELIN